MNKHLLSTILLLILSYGFSYAQDDWNKQMSKDKKVEVWSKIKKEKNEAGNSEQIVEYISTTTANASIADCISVMKNIDLHKEFYEDTELSEKIEDISENEWLIYYYMDAPWPLPNSDVVIQMKFHENKEEGTAIFEGFAAPNLYEDKDVRRMTFNDISYTFKKIDEEHVSIRIHSIFSPVVNVPDWMVNSWFPKGPAEISASIVKLIEES